MAFFKKESLEQLRQRVDLVDLISSYVELRRSGATYKGLCPFHEEKTPSFVVQKGDRHFHCFGCQAHGDAIEFLMSFLHLSFFDAVEHLAHRFHLTLEYEEQNKKDTKSVDKRRLRQVLSSCARFYHYYLLFSPEGQKALKYLYNRGICLNFIKRFKLGLAPEKTDALLTFLKAEKIPLFLMEQAGLIRKTAKGKQDFFSDRIMFPIFDPTGLAIGFSARKFKESTFGGKYVNSPETPVFKKSSVLFGLNLARREIAKERNVVIVEGQIDALRLSFEGLNTVIATQGTALGEGHVKELQNLGINQVALVFDSDSAGKEAAFKAGDRFQKVGIEVKVVTLPQGLDPDSFVLEQGIDAFIDCLTYARPYLEFAVSQLGEQYNIASPAGKTALVQSLTKQIEAWENPVMVYESLKQLAKLLELPLDLLQTKSSQAAKKQEPLRIKKATELKDADNVLEQDLLRLLLFLAKTEPEVFEWLQKYVVSADFLDHDARAFFEAILHAKEDNKPLEVFSLAFYLDEERQDLLEKLLKRKVHPKRAKDMLAMTVQKLLERNWLKSREEISKKLKDKSLSKDQELALIQDFDKLSKQQPQVKAF